MNERQRVLYEIANVIDLSTSLSSVAGPPTLPGQEAPHDVAPQLDAALERRQQAAQGSKP